MTADKHAQNRKRSGLTVVGIGASAGGLKALESFFRALEQFDKTDFPAFVVVTHMSPDHKSMMVELLSRYTSLPILQVEGGEKLEPGKVYVIKPGTSLTIHKGLLRSRKLKSGVLRHPIDAFFRSLAKEMKENAFAVVLSGTGSDGTLGIKEVNGAGGVVMVQREASAEYAGMPASATATGMADVVAPVEELPGKILGYLNVSREFKEKSGKSEPLSADSEPFHQILAHIRKATGHDFSSYKPATLIRRLEKRMLLAEIESPSEYLSKLQSDHEEARHLFKDMLIGVTNFFRDPEAFEYLEKEVIPQIAALKEDWGSIRIWSAGTSTGEEAYSLAILLREYLDSVGRSMEVQVFATDLDERAIDIARVATYPTAIEADVSPERLRRFFRKRGDGYAVSPHLREMVVFARHDLIGNPPFFKMDMIICRNLLIYLDNEIQKKIIPVFFYALNPKGFLFLGPSETVGVNSELFSQVNGKWKIYQRRDASLARPVELPLNTPTQSGRGREKAERTTSRSQNFDTMVEKALLAQYARPAVLVNRSSEVLHFYGDTSDYLLPPRGEPSTNIFKLARPFMLAQLRAALHETRNSTKSVAVENIDPGSETAPFTLRVERLKHGNEDDEFWLVSFEAGGKDGSGSHGHGPAGHREKDSLVQRLEEQLRVNSEQLQGTIEDFDTAAEELKSSNEELLSMNEELHATNEELETSREELQTLNEELSAVNAELRSKVSELDKAHSDMENLLASSDIATLFLDGELNIRRFTPPAMEIFHLVSSDTGRPLAHIGGVLDGKTVLKSARRVLRSRKREEQEIVDEDGNWYLCRVSPYRSLEGIVDGVVLTFTDITRIKEEQHKREQSEKRLNHAQAVSRTGSWERDLKTDKGSWSEGMYRLLGYEPGEVPSSSRKFLSHVHPDDRERVEKEIRQAFSNGSTLELDMRIITTDGELRWVHSAGEMHQRDDGTKFLIGTLQDITARKGIEEELSMGRKLLSTALEALGAGMYEYEIPLEKHCRFSKRWYQIVGLQEDDAPKCDELNDWFVSRIHPEDLEQLKSKYCRFLNGEFEKYSSEFRFRLTEDEEWKWLLDAARAYDRDQQGRLRIVVGALLDITDRKRNEEELERQVAERTRKLGFFEKRFRTMLDNFPDGVMVLFDKDLRYLLSGGSEWERYDIDPTETIGKTPSEIFGEEIGKEIEKRFREALQGKVVSFGMEYAENSYEVRVLPVESGGNAAGLAMVQNVTARRAAEARLQENEELYRALVEGAPDVIVRFDSNLRYYYVNPAMEEITGVPSGSFVGKSLSEGEFKDGGSTLHGFEKALTQALETGEEMDFEGEFETVQGERNFHFRLAPERTSGGSTRGVLALGRDVTDYRQLQEELKHSKEQAETASRAKSNFLANMSHEVRSPITGILGITELLLRRSQDESNRERLELVREAGESLLAIVNDILDLSKIEAGHIELENRNFSIKVLVDKTIGLFAIQAGQKNLRLKSRVGNDVPDRLCGDGRRLGQVLRNLVSNAVKFTDSGEVLVEVKKLPVPDVYRFSVSDTGAGIPQEKLSSLFTEFIQLDSSFAKRHGGSGLGLSITRKLVEMMGGEIRVRTTLGKGSVFEMDLKFNPAGTEKESRVVGLVPGRPLNILVAEDNPINRRFLEDLLLQAGHSVSLAANGYEVLEQLRQQAFDVVLMDIQMPRMDGLEAARLIRADTTGDFDPQLPIIALTAYNMKGDRETFIEAGMDEHVAKPVSFEELNTKLTLFTSGMRPRGARSNVNSDDASSKDGDKDNSGDSREKETMINIEELQNRFKGKSEMFVRFVGDFADDARTVLENIEQAAQCGDLDVVRDQAHRLAGSAALLAARPLREKALVLENLAREGRSEDLAVELPAFRRIVEQVIDELEAVADNMN